MHMCDSTFVFFLGGVQSKMFSFLGDRLGIITLQFLWPDKSRLGEGSFVFGYCFVWLMIMK